MNHYIKSNPFVCKSITFTLLFNWQDINECLVDNGGCSQFCNNTIGSYRCTCKPGYRLDATQKNCIG